METLPQPRNILSWYLDAGVDEVIGEQPIDRYALACEAANKRQQDVEDVLKSAKDLPIDPHVKSPSDLSLEGASLGPVLVRPSPALPSQDVIKQAVELASKAETVEDLYLALAQFDGCGLKKTATKLVFTDGPSDARVMLIGDIPGTEEDRQGIPFIGPGGQLLNKMLASIGLERSQVLVGNAVFWRPPGKRHANLGEIAACLPFVERLVEIVDPKLLITLGGPVTHALLAQQGHISKLVGHWHTYETPKMSHPIAACGMYHPEFLLTSPNMKRPAWNALLGIKEKLKDL